MKASEPQIIFPPQAPMVQDFPSGPQHQQTSKDKTTTTSDKRTKSPSGGGVRRKLPPQSRSLLSQAIVSTAVSGIQNNVERLIRDSPFFTQQQNDDEANNNNTSAIPLFHRKEIQMGRLLGSGSFSNVCSVNAIHLKLEQASTSTTISPEQQQARCHLQEEILSNNNNKYAIKFVKKKLLKNPKSFVHAAADLVMEAKFLSRIQDHPHILKLRAMTYNDLAAYKSGGYDSYFIIMDRLMGGTLDQCITEWANDTTDTATTISKDDVSLDQQICQQKILIRKLQYATDTSDALLYLHTQRLIFRDLKPQNIGFLDTNRLDLQLFDFGLCRDLPRRQREADEEDENACYKMSGAGTRSYMAPEILNTHMYNLKADVYSWAMVCYEMFSLERPFGHMDKETHEWQVCQRGERPPLKLDSIPESLQALLQASWNQDYTQRYSMKMVYSQMQQILREEESVLKEMLQEQQQRQKEEVNSRVITHLEDEQDGSEVSIELELHERISTSLQNSSQSMQSFDSASFGNSAISIDFDTGGYLNDNSSKNNSSREEQQQQQLEEQ